MVRYEYVVTNSTDLQETLDLVYKYQDKIVAVTQNGDSYTIFLESSGNLDRRSFNND